MVVGRDPASDVQLADKTVSRRHALLQIDEDRVRITDLGSTSKTRINGAALVRDVPSTLEAGDLVRFGKLEMTFRATAPPPARPEPKAPAKPPAAPPPAAKAAKPRAARPSRERTAPSAGAGPWKVVAIVLAFVVVILLAAFLATRGNEAPAPVVLEEPAAAPSDEPPEPEADSTSPAETKPEPPPEPEPKVDRAPAGALPPGGYAPVEDFPDLLEVDGKDYFAVAVVSFGGGGVEVRGRDGRVYTLARREVTRILDRADLVRRVAVQRAGLARDDIESRLQLARWCAARYVPTEAIQLLDEVLKQQPGHEAARELRARLEGDR